MTRPKIIVALLTNDQEFQKLQAADAERAAARAGMDIEIVYAKNNARLQAEQLYRFVNALQAARPVAIVAHPVDDEVLGRVARDAVKAGIAWIQIGRESPYVDPLRTEFPSIPISIVRTDQLAIGRIQGEQFRTLLPAGGNILYVQGPPATSAARQRLQGMQEAIVNAKLTVKIIEAEWTEVSAEHAVESWLRLSSSEKEAPQLIAAQNDAMAIGARKAIAARRPQWSALPFTGCDGLPEGGRKLVDERQLAATVIVQSNAGPAIDLVATHLKSGTPAPPRVILPPKPYPERLRV